MRLDVISYAIGIIFFIVTLTAVVYSFQQQSVWVVSTVVIGLAFFGVGYTQRPKPAQAPMITSAPPMSISQPIEQHQEQQPPTPEVATITQPVEVKAEPTEPSTQPVAPLQPTVLEAKTIEPQPVVEPIRPPEEELMKVKGIGQKRAEQLRAKGINSVEDLANASAKDLASKLNVSPKITDKWIKNAQSFDQKPA